MHTPGPWKFTQECVDSQWHIVTSGSRIVANVHIRNGNEMDAANARLIAAAPDLLEALVEMRAWQGSVQELVPEALSAKVQRAIAKAKGGAA